MDQASPPFVAREEVQAAYSFPAGERRPLLGAGLICEVEEYNERCRELNGSNEPQPQPPGTIRSTPCSDGPRLPFQESGVREFVPSRPEFDLSWLRQQQIKLRRRSGLGPRRRPPGGRSISKWLEFQPSSGHGSAEQPTSPMSAARPQRITHESFNERFLECLRHTGARAPPPRR